MKRSLMLLAIAATLGPVSAQLVYNSQPSDDVWAYEFAFDPANTALLRVWGDGTDAVDPSGWPPGLNHSYGYAKWNLSALNPSRFYWVDAATIVVNQTAPGFTLAQTQDAPLEARTLAGGWSEAAWSFAAPNPVPGSMVLGVGDFASYNAAGYPITIDLLWDREAFNSCFNAAVIDGELNVGFVSRINPGGQGGQAFYRFFSRNDAGGRGPVLRIEYRVAGDTNGDGCSDDADLANALSDFGGPPIFGSTDFNGDGLVDDADLAVVLAYFGNGC